MEGHTLFNTSMFSQAAHSLCGKIGKFTGTDCITTYATSCLTTYKGAFIKETKPISSNEGLGEGFCALD